MAVKFLLVGEDHSSAAIAALNKRLSDLAKNVTKQQQMMGKGAAKAAGTFSKVWTSSFKSVVGSVLNLRTALGGLLSIGGLGALVSGAAKSDVAVKGLANRLKLTEQEVIGIGVGLTKAASGTISFRRAIQLANKALKFLPVEQMKTTMEFISKRALISGENIEVALDRVITGLARGSTLLLDDFGILVDGVKGVREEFDKFHGEGAFEKLSGSDQKRELVKAAMKEMKEDIRDIGDLSGTFGASFAKLGPAIRNILDKTGLLLLEGPLSFLKPLIEGISKVGQIVPLLDKQQMFKLSSLIWNVIKEVGIGVILDIFTFIKRQVKELIGFFVSEVGIALSRAAEQLIESFPFGSEMLAKISKSLVNAGTQIKKDLLEPFEFKETKFGLEKSVPKLLEFINGVNETGRALEDSGLNKLRKQNILTSISDQLKATGAAGLTVGGKAKEFGQQALSFTKALFRGTQGEFLKGKEGKKFIEGTKVIGEGIRGFRDLVESPSRLASSAPFLRQQALAVEREKAFTPEERQRRIKTADFLRSAALLGEGKRRREVIGFSPQGKPRFGFVEGAPSSDVARETLKQVETLLGLNQIIKQETMVINDTKKSSEERAAAAARLNQQMVALDKILTGKP